MKRIICALALAIPGLAGADIIKCTFTEPFYTTTYSMAQQSLTVVNNLTNARSVERNVSFQIIDSGVFEIRSLGGAVRQRLTLDWNGSDGMSDRVFPYSVRWRGLNGGCTSNFLHVRN